MAEFAKPAPRPPKRARRTCECELEHCLVGNHDYLAEGEGGAECCKLHKKAPVELCDGTCVLCGQRVCEQHDEGAAHCDKCGSFVCKTCLELAGATRWLDEASVCAGCRSRALLGLRPSAPCPPSQCACGSC